MNTRSLEHLQRLLTQPSDSEDEPAEGSLLWAAAQLRRIARMLEDMQAGPRQPGDVTPPVPEAFPAAGACAHGAWRDETEPPVEGHSPHPHKPLAPEARHVVQ
ncbi:MAG: hypothetical protein SOZ39_05930 [Desulfovibrio piger]|uniref:hypothetical protein n=1 Tax=Desulfovibrio piger TaxID=901 RepID=UPI002430F677|nr:hypothetical protein [Desulfovibrio piger]MDY3880661.1 hypothetical protein [Desulfovibrio piger]